MKRRKSKNKKLLKLASNFKPFDYGFVLELERQGLKQIADYLAKSQIAEGSEDWAKEIRLALKLLDIADGRDSAYSYWSSCVDNMTVYVNTKNGNRFLPNQDYSKNIIKNVLREEKAWFLYHKIRCERMRKWWD